MPAKKKLTQTLVQQIALLHRRGVPQVEIGERLGNLSQSTVSRALDEARDAGWLVTRTFLALSKARVEELEQMIYAPDLKERLCKVQERGEHLRALRILECADPPTGPDDYKKAFGCEVAQHLVDRVFPGVSTMGVTWGGTLLATVRGLDSADKTGFDKERRIRFFPVCGVPLYLNEMTKATSQSLVASLDQRLYDEEVNELNFVDIGANIPLSVGEHCVEVFYDYFRQRVGYRKVFGEDGESGLVCEMDAVITSVSPPQDHNWIESAASAGGMDPGALNESTYGNIGGNFLPRPDTSKERADEVMDVNRSWTGIREKHFHACAERAAQREWGGTIVIAHGNRAEIILACVRRSLVSELIIDPACAKELSRALDA